MIADLALIEETAVGREVLEKGRKEGWEKGLEKGREEIVLLMRRHGQTAEQIAGLTGLPLDKVRVVLANG